MRTLFAGVRGRVPRRLAAALLLLALCISLQACKTTEPTASGPPSTPEPPASSAREPGTAAPDSTPAPPPETETSPVTTEAPPPEDESWKLVLVNANHPLPEGFTVELKALRNGHHVDVRIYPELQQMFDDARATGIYPFINESFRTQERQQEILDKYIANYRATGLSQAEAEAKALETVARPGTSEHQLGLALDIIAEYDADSTATWNWLKQNCWRYGFILRYPADKTEITGISYEPWHFRYVGKEAAKEIMDRGLCLEEYLGED